MLEINPKQKNVLNAVKQIKKDMKKKNLNEKKKDQTTKEKKVNIIL